jgi:Leucine-rich repeat (LRR) protein
LSKLNLAIRHLDLSHNKISDVGGVPLATALCINTSLTYLNLSKNSLGNPTGYIIKKQLKENRFI